jgi:hypothetical protein
MRVLKVFVLLALTTIALVSCQPPPEEGYISDETEGKTFMVWNRRYQIIKIDSCEYIISTEGNFCVHKGNCKNHKEKDHE